VAIEERADLGIGLGETPLTFSSSRMRRFEKSDALDPLDASLPSVKAPPELYTPPYSGGSKSEYRRGVTSTIRKYSSLEDMVANHPELLQPGSKLRVERIEPKWVQDPNTGSQIRVSGILAEEPIGIGTLECLRKYGGFRLRGVGSAERAPRDNPGGPPVRYDVAIAEFEAASPPNLDALPFQEQEADDMFGRRSVIPFMQIQQQPSQQNESIANKIAERFIDSSMSPRDAPSADSALKASLEQSRIAMDVTAQTYRAQLEAAQREKSMLADKVDDLQSQLRELLARKAESTPPLVEMAQALGAITANRNNGMSQEERALMQTMHERELVRTNEAHRTEIAAIRSELEAEKRRADERLKDLREDHERDRMMWREEAERRERTAKERGEDEVKRVRELLETQLRLQERDKTQSLEMTRGQFELLTKTNESSLRGEIHMRELEISRLRDENGRIKVELDRFMAERTRPIAEQVEDIKRTATTLGLVSDDDDMPELPEGGDFKEKILNRVVDMAPALLQTLPAILSAKSGQGGQGNVQPQRPHGPALAPPSGVTVQQQPRALPRPVAPPQQMVFASGDDPKIVASAPKPPPPAPRGVPIVSRPPAPPPVNLPVMTSPPPTQEGQNVEQEQSAEYWENNPKQSVSLDWSGFEWLPILDDNDKTAIFAELENGCNEELSPSQMVDRLMERYGAGVISAVPQLAPVEKILESIVVCPALKDTTLATRRGSSFLRDVWEEIVTRPT